MAMKYYGKAQNAARGILQAFEEGRVPDALAQVFVKGAADKHCASYSLFNRFIVAIHGYSDARGFNQWKKVGRHVKKGERAFQILAPVFAKSERKKDDGTTEKVQFLTGFRGVNVFGLEQTDGEPLEHDQSVVQFLDSLPLLEVANAWGLKVEAYNGKNGNALGYYIPGSAIEVGTENLSTWAHELIHAADDRLGDLRKDGRAMGEVVAELGGAVLLKCIGMEVEADLGGAYEYIKSWAATENKEVIDACSKVINRVLKAVDLILSTADELETA